MNEKKARSKTVRTWARVSVCQCDSSDLIHLDAKGNFTYDDGQPCEVTLEDLEILVKKGRWHELGTEVQL